jgi:hypothetical protein
MNNSTRVGLVVWATITCLSICERSVGGENASLERAKPASARDEVPYPNCVRIFSGDNFDGWEAEPSTWSIVDGAVRGVGGTSRLAYTKADYGSFRLIFTAR